MVSANRQQIEWVCVCCDERLAAKNKDCVHRYGYDFLRIAGIKAGEKFGNEINIGKGHQEDTSEEDYQEGHQAREVVQDLD